MVEKTLGFYGPPFPPPPPPLEMLIEFYPPRSSFSPSPIRLDQCEIDNVPHHVEFLTVASCSEEEHFLGSIL